MPKNAVLVGTNIGADVRWLGLKEGEDFASMIDLSGLFRVFNPQYKSWSQFAQDHVAKCLLGVDAGTHDAKEDAIKSMRLYHTYNQLQQSPEHWEAAKAQLIATPPASSFAKLNPTFEDCCMGNRKTCRCGGVFFF